MRLMDCFFKPYQPTDVKPTCSDDEMADLETHLEHMIIFALVWSVGATTTAEGRIKFDSKLKELMGKGHRCMFPDNKPCYEFMYSTTAKDWIRWDAVNSKKFEIDPKLAYAEIIVPTFDSIRYKWVKKFLLENRKHVLCPGPTGTGKTVNINSLLN